MRHGRREWHRTGRMIPAGRSIPPPRPYRRLVSRNARIASAT
jgi:hypothetical protein